MPHWTYRKKAEAWRSHASRLLGIMRNHGDIPVIVADNVADYYYAGTGQEYWDLQVHFPNLAPPYPVYWIEFRLPRLIHSDKLGDTDVSKRFPGLNGRAGWLFFGSRREDVKGENIPEKTHWVLTAELFIDYGLGDDSIVGPHGCWTAAINAEGQLIDRPWLQIWTEEGSPESEVISQSINAWTHPALLTVCFLHCRNVTVERHECPVKLAKRTKERHGYIPSPFHTLVIEPLKQILRKEGKSDTHGLAKAMHIARGHFKDYRQGKGLFGKYHQLVWHDAVVRGTRGRGGDPPHREIEVKVK